MPQKFQVQEPAHSLLYTPASLAVTRIDSDVQALNSRLEHYLEYKLNTRQQEAFQLSFSTRLGLLWGPPGTGKTSTLGAIVLGWLEAAWAAGKPFVIGVGSSNYNAIDNLLSEVVELLALRQKHTGQPSEVRAIRVRSKGAAPPSHPGIEDVEQYTPAGDALAELMEDPPCPLVVGGTWIQLGRLTREDDRPCKPWFDLFVIDEASQVGVANAAGYYLLLKDDGHVLLAGDDKQLGPIKKFEVSVKIEGIYDSIFAYTRLLLKDNPEKIIALDENYRTNEEIAGWPRERFYPSGYKAFNPNRRLNIKLPSSSNAPPDWPPRLPWSEHYFRLLDPNNPICVVTYGSATATVSNPFEAQTVAALTYLYRYLLVADGYNDDMHDFWRQRLGIVTPHRAQMSSIKNFLTTQAGLPMDPVPEVDTVDRFQGQERDLILSSYTVADKDFIASEAKFILSSKRFNVTLTRARAKFIIIVSNALIQHLPSDMDVAYDASHMQLFVEEYCEDDQPAIITLPYFIGGKWTDVKCKLKKNRPLLKTIE